MLETNVAKILVVDDEVELKNALVEALSAHSFEVRGFTNGSHALSALREEVFDVLVSDLMMPELDGINLIEKALEIDPHLVPIIMTGQGTIQTAVDAMKIGAFDYVLKPFRLSTMLPTLTRAINARRLRLENMQLRETIAIYELCQTIAMTLDKQALISKLADAALQQTEADEVSVLLPTSSADELYVAAVRGKNRQRLLGERVPLEESISGWVVRQREPLLLTGEVNDARFHTLWPHPEIKSALSIPMQAGNKLIGTININALNRARPFTLGQMKALTILASAAAAALESASLFEQLRTAEANYRSIFENAVEGIFQSTADKRFITANSSLARILGYSSPEEVITAFSDAGRQLYVRPEDAEEVTRSLEKDGTVQGFECEAYRKDGEKIWLSLNLRCVYDETGCERFREGTIEDITERKQAEEVLRKSEAAFKELFDDAPVAYHEIDKEGRFTRVNLTEQQLLGYTAGEMQGRFPSEFIIDKGSREAVAKKMSGKVPLQPFERTFVRKDGTLVPMEIQDRLLYDTKGKICGIRSTLHDITERKRAEEALRESEEKYRTILERMEEGYAEVDLRGNYVFVNDSFCRISGRSRSELLGVNYRELFDREQHQLLFDTYHKVYETGEPIQGFEYDVTWKDGTRRVVEESVTLKSDAEGRPIGFTGTRRDCTDRKQAEKALRESEERYRDLVENAQDIIYSHDLKGNYTSVNKAGELITGYSREEALKLNLLEMVAPEHAAKAKEMLHRKLAGESTTAYEIEILAKDGRRVPLEVNTRLMLENGVPAAITGIARDITERKKAEADLRFQKSLLESQTEASIDGVLVVSPAGEILSFNHRFLDLWGIADEEILGKSDREALSSVSDRVKSPQQFGERVQYLYEHPDERSEEEIELSDGRTLERHSAPVHGPQGEHYGRVWFFRDITDRKLAQAELTRLATAVNQTADSIVITDTAGNIEYVNPAFELVTGFTKEEAIGQNPRMLKSNSNPPAIYKDLWETITRGDVWVGQLINKRKDGSLFNERATISAVRDEGGKIAHFIAVKKDTTHETHLEAQLRQSQKMEAIGQLAGGVAHDFNNLLTAISGYTSLALQRLDEHNPIRPYLEEVKKAGDRAANLTRQLLAFGRKQILQPIPLDLNSTVSDMNKMLRRLIGEDINLSANLATNLKRIKADPGQIEQVLMNLVVNARDAMPQGGRLTIETANVELDREYARGHVGIQPGNYVMLAVSDTGTGMSEETRARIFEPFFTTKEQGKGTGLGLSTVYGIVQQSGGSIWVYSELNQGTSFKVYLPQLEAPVKADEEKPAQEIVPRGSETILLVEDEEVVRGLATHILKDAGYKVLAARGGAEAIQLCAQTAAQIDLLLTDVVMPETSGKEVADRVTALMPHTKVLFMSGYTDQAIVHHGVLDSNVEFIQKPFTPMGLSKKVREVLDSNGHRERD